MLKYCICCSSVFFVLSSANANNNVITPEFFIEVESFSASPAVPISQLIDDMQGPAVTEGEYALSSSRIEAGLRTKKFAVSVLERMVFYAEFTNDTAKIIQEERNDANNTRGKSYDIDLYGFFLKASGAKLEIPVWSSDSFGLTIAGTYYEGSDMQQGVLKGRVYTIEDLEGHLELDYSYSKDVFFNREPGDVNGYGYSFDFSACWSPDSETYVRFSATDVYSRIRWRNQQYTVAMATTDTVIYDSEGRINARPAVEWFEVTRTAIQELPRLLDISVTRDLNQRWSLGASLKHYESANFVEVEASLKVTDSHRVSASISPTHNNLGIGYQVGGVSLKISSDRFYWKKAHNLSVSLEASMPLWPLSF